MTTDKQEHFLYIVIYIEMSLVLLLLLFYSN